MSSILSKYSALSAQLRQNLVASLVESGAIRSSAIQQAFLSLPREAFLPYFFAEDEASSGMTWRRFSADEITPELYLTSIYRDDSLVTKIDERNWAVSSSSMPSVMAKMLEALDLQPGQHVLEIGTGTGYNAALLAAITGDPHAITTIERDTVLAANAREALEQVIGKGMTVVVGDGFVGWEQGAPYDRILATASLPTLPWTWVEQLRPGGKIVMDLQGSLAASGFLVVEKTPEGKAIGNFLSTPLYFMPLATEKIAGPHIPKLGELLQRQRSETFVLEANHIFPEKLFDSNFRWLLQWRFPGCHISKRRQVQHESNIILNSILVIDPNTNALLRFQQPAGQSGWQGEEYGSHFWADLQSTYADFMALEQPQPQQYRLEIDKEGSSLRIGHLHLSI